MTRAWKALALSSLLVLGAAFAIPGAQGREPLPPLLNSERIEMRFGSYGLDVLEASDRLRISSLFSTREGQKITRTLAIVTWPDPVDARLLAEHQLILGGGSIGAILKSRGWQLNKQNVYFGELSPGTAWSSLWLMMQIPPGALAVHIYELEAVRKDEQVHYATIAEIHHPEYLDLERLQSIYSPATEPDRDRVDPILNTVRQGLDGL